MAGAAPELPHDLPDRIVRDALLHPNNLRALLRDVAPAIADRLAYEQLEVVKPAFLLDDWRKRKRDLLVRIPFRDAEGREVLICILIEHQSTSDPAMPLRLLVYAVLHWEQEWRAWEEKHERGQPLRLTPVIPVVLHTGQVAWDKSRRLADLFAAPEELKAWLPEWTMPLWDLPEHAADDLLKSGEPWWQTLAVARAENEGTDEFRRVMQEALKSLEPLGLSENVYWHQQVKMVLYWSLYRRPRREHGELIDAARASQSTVQLQQEMTTMSQTMEMTWEEELLERADQMAAQKVAQKVAQATAQATAQAYRDMARRLLQDRFPSLPEEVTRRIDDADVEWLKAAVLRVAKVASPDELLQS